MHDADVTCDCCGLSLPGEEDRFQWDRWVVCELCDSCACLDRYGGIMPCLAKIMGEAEMHDDDA